MKNVVTPVGLAATGVFALTIVFGSWFTVDQGQRGVITQNGAVVKEVGPGLSFKMPWVQNVHTFDVKTDLLQVKLGGHTSDQQEITQITASVNYHVSPDRVTDLYGRLGDNYVNAKLLPTFNYEVTNQLGKITAQDLIKNKDKLALSIQDSLSKQMAGYDIIIETVQLGAPTFNDAFNQNIQALIAQEVSVRTKQQQLEAAKVDAQTAVVTAQGAADAKLAQAKAEAQAIQLKSQALQQNPALVSLTMAERWNGQMPQFINGGAGTNMLLDMTSMMQHK